MIVLAAVVQTAIVPALAVDDIRPDLMICLVVFGSLRARWQDMLAANCVLGLLKDVYCAAPIGTFGLLFLLAGLLLSLAGRHVFSEHPLVQIAAAFVAALACDAAAAGLLKVLHDLPTAAPLLERALWGAVYTALAAPIVAWLMRRPARWLSLPVRTAARS